MIEAGRETPRGFDSYRISLGDELRGERASMGKSLLDVQRDLRIKAAHIDAIENADPDAIPYASFVAGYVRAYARYLNLDDTLVLRRFCEESGFDAAGATVSAAPVGGARARAPRGRGRGADDIDALFAGSRLAAASRAASYNASVGATLRSAGSVAVMAALVTGLGYGAWSVLENIQRVGFAPSPDAPRALITAPALDAGPVVAQAGVATLPMIDTAALAAVYAAQETPPPVFEPSDGPISAIDPERSGVYAPAPVAIQPPVDPQTIPIDPGLTAALARLDAGRPAAAPAFDAGGPATVRLLARQEAWVRVRDAEGAVAHEALMAAGDVWTAPDGADGFTLRAGNAGGVFLQVGRTVYGPIGRPGGVVSNVDLDAEAIRRVFASSDPVDADGRTALARP